MYKGRNRQNDENKTTERNKVLKIPKCNHENSRGLKTRHKQQNHKYQ